MKTKEKDTKKSFDAVKFMREQRDRISKEIMNLTPEEIVENKKTFDVLPCKGSTLEDISLELFKLRYLTSAIDADTLAKNGNDLKSQLASFKFYEFSDRIEISNAGGLYGKAQPENFPNENDYRNPAISEAVKNLGFVNGCNVGVEAAITALGKNGSPAPEFLKDQPFSFSVKIFKRF